MEKVELLLPVGNNASLRAAVNNGADAVYLGLNRYNARTLAKNFNERNIFSTVEYCHRRKVKVYVTFNTLIKNHELKDFLEQINIADSAKVDGIIIQNPNFIPIINKNFPTLPIHLSTQATITNTFSVPQGIERIILPRELTLSEISNFSEKYKTEIFVHGALCFAYSGQCLFSSLAGGRSGNRGRCAQPCRKKYNNKYLISTMDLCAIEQIPRLIKAGVSTFKIEGRMRSPLYVATVAKIYRKYIDLYYINKFKIDEFDIDMLKLVFNREFTQGFAFDENIVDSMTPTNRGLYLGQLIKGEIKLKHGLNKGDIIVIWENDVSKEQIVEKIKRDCKLVNSAKLGDIIKINDLDLNKVQVYKTNSFELKAELGDEIKEVKPKIKKHKIYLPNIRSKLNDDCPKLFVKVYNKKSALEADNAKASIIYYDVLKPDCNEVKGLIKNSEFFVFTPRILSDMQIKEIVQKIDLIKPVGVLVGNKALLKFLKNYEIHLDYSFNCFNDIDIKSYDAIPIISPELNFNELKEFKNKNFILPAHGNIVVMTSKQKLKAPELIDDEGRHFVVREYYGYTEILNSKQLGLFSKIHDCIDEGINYFYLDLSKDVGKFIRIYQMIIFNTFFDDKKISKGFTKGHFERGVK